MRMRTLRVVLGLAVIMGPATARAQVAPDLGPAPVQTVPSGQPPAPTGPAPGTMPAPAPAAAPPPAAPAPAPEAYPRETGTVSGPGGETIPVVAEGLMVPLAARRLLLRMGEGAAQVFVKINMSKSAEGKPTTVTPDLYYGVNDFLQLGIVHSSPLGWQTPGSKPTAFCVTGSNNGCPKAYNNLGIDLLALVLPGPVELAGHGRFDFDPFDPFRINLVLGFEAKLRLPWFSLFTYPSIQIGLNKRDQAGGPTPSGNKEMIYIPGEIELQVTPLLAVIGQAAFYTQAEGFTDHYRIPLGAAVLFTVSPMLDLGVRWAWDNVAKTTAGVGRNDERSLVAVANLYY